MRVTPGPTGPADWGVVMGARGPRLRGSSARILSQTS